MILSRTVVPFMAFLFIHQIATVIASNATAQDTSRYHEKIASINIINVATSEVIGQLVDGSIIDLSQYGLTSASQLNFEFVTDGTVDFVGVRVSGSSSFVYRTDQKPFTLCGNSPGRNFYGCKNLKLGLSTIDAQPYGPLGTSTDISGDATKIAFSITQTDLKVFPSSKAANILRTLRRRKPVTSPPTGLPAALDTASTSATYDVSLGLTGNAIDLTPSDIATFQNAGKRWGEIIVGDLPNQSTAGFSKPPGCKVPVPSVIDDLHICGDISYVDGPYGVLGWSGISHVRSGSNLPLIGYMAFDSGDMPRLRLGNLLYSVILHEMGHILGIGTLWSILGVTGKDAENCPYRGIYGNTEYRSLSGCTGTVPMALGGGTGTRCAHFSDTCFKDELMTGWRSGTMPISRLTVASLRDIGYTVSYAKANAYSSANMNPTCVCRRRDRNLRVSAVKAIGEENNSTSTTWATRQLSDNGYRNALKFGKKILKQHKRQFLSSDVVSVIYDDGNNGVFSIRVRQDDL